MVIEVNKEYVKVSGDYIAVIKGLEIFFVKIIFLNAVNIEFYMDKVG